MLFQLASVPLSPRRVLCRSGECRQRISYTKQRWAQLLFFGNDLLVYFDRTSGRTFLQIRHLIERKREEVMEKSFMIPLSELKSMRSYMKLNTESRMLGPFPSSGSRDLYELFRCCLLSSGGSIFTAITCISSTCMPSLL